MKINVNEHNEILSYEGTPVELAEFIATGILDPYMYEDEDCECKECEMVEPDESVIVPDAMDEDTVEMEEKPKTADEILDSYKDIVREQLESEGYTCSDEEFEDAYRTAIEIMGPLKKLFE